MFIKYIISHYRLIAVDLSRQKKLDSDYNATGAGDDQYMFFWTFLEKKNKEMRLTFSQGIVTVLWNLSIYKEATV